MLFYIVALIFAGEDIPPNQNCVDNIVVVFDASGSMNGEMPGTKESKISIAKNALISVVKNIGSTTNIGIVVFGNTSGWIYPLDYKNETTLITSVSSIKEGGGTPLGDYIKIGADCLLKQRGKQFGCGSFRLLVITDGEADFGQKVDERVQEILSRGIIVDAIGVGMRENHTLAKKVNSYRKGNDPESLTKAIKQTFAEIEQKSGTSTIDEDFQLLQGLDSDIATQIITALSVPQNQPIGEKPKTKAIETQSKSNVLFAPLGLICGGGVIGLIIFIALIKVIRNY